MIAKQCTYEWHRFSLLNEHFFLPFLRHNDNSNEWKCVINKTENWQFIRPYFWCLLSQFCVVYCCKRVPIGFFKWNFYQMCREEQKYKRVRKAFINELGLSAFLFLFCFWFESSHGGPIGKKNKNQLFS